MIGKINRKIGQSSEWLQALFARINETPIIVLGNQKSGTTAIAALLGMHAGLNTQIDLRRLYKGSTQLLIHDDQLSVHDLVRSNRLEFSRDIIKEPCLTFFYPKLRKRFPRAQFVIILRDPRENIRSVLNRLGIDGTKPALSQDEFETLAPEWRLMLDGAWLGLTGDTYIDHLAARWNLATDVYLEHSEEMILVKYENFNERKAETIRELAARLSLLHKADIAGRVNDQFQARGVHVKPINFFGPNNLERIESICGERMSQFGYGP